MPMPQGATYLYERFYKPTLVRYQPKIDAVLSKGQKALVRNVFLPFSLVHAVHVIAARACQVLNIRSVRDFGLLRRSAKPVCSQC